MIFPEFGIRTELAVAVVFPELVRYSALMDFMETTAVKALYQQKGVKGADFSIGRFQMKPSFVEDLERQWMRTEWRHEYGIYFDLSETLEAHRICVLRLDDRNWQCIYLAMFLKLLYRRFRELAAGSLTLSAPRWVPWQIWAFTRPTSSNGCSARPSYPRLLA